MHKRIDFLLILSIVFLSLFFTAIHVSAVQQDESVFTMEEIVVIATRYPDEILESVVSVEVLSREEIEASQAENLAGVLQNIGGLEILDYGYQGGLKSIGIRGSSPEQVLIMVDGQVVNDPQSGKIDLGQIPSDIIEKIEIYRGPASALYGGNALGGVLNIITRAAEEESKGAAAFSYGSYHTQKYQVSYQDHSDDLGYYLAGQYYKTDGEQENSQMDKISFMAKLSHELDKQSDLNLSLRYHDYQRGLPGPTNNPTPDAIQKDRDLNFNVRWQKREEDRDINMMAWYDFHRLYYDNPGEWGHTGPSIHKTHSTGLSFDITHYDFSLDDGNNESDHTLTWGGDIKNNWIDSTDIGNQQDLNGAVFIQDVWQPTEEDLSIIAGIRYDYNQIYGGQFNPRVGITYQLQDEISVHASVGRAYRPPTFDDLYWPEDAYVGGNPDLLPETAWSYEAGLRFANEEGDTQAELNIFRKNVNQLINWAADDAGVWRPSNIGSARVDGVEALLKKELNKHILGNVSYTYLDARDLDTDARLKPRHKIGFGLTYSDQVGDHEDNFTFGLDGYMVSGRPDDLESYALFDIGISRELTIDEEDNQKVRLNLSVKNVLNQQPELVSGYPIQGRTFLAGISTEF